MQESMKRVFVFDLGGGTFDVSLLQIEDGVFEVLATRGDTNLGGTDIDYILVKHCISHYKKESGVDLTNNKRAISRLRKSCEIAKHDLSYLDEVTIECDALVDDTNFCLEMTITKFERLILPFLQRLKRPVQDVLKDADLASN